MFSCVDCLCIIVGSNTTRCSTLELNMFALKFSGHRSRLLLIKAMNEMHTVGDTGGVTEDRGELNTMEVNLM